jgi:hypothetical protein
MTTPGCATLVEHGTFLGYDQGSEVYDLAGTLWIADEYATLDGPAFDVYAFRGSASGLPTDEREKIVFLLD